MAPQERPLPVRVVTSDELGLLKVAQSSDGSALSSTAIMAKWGQPDRQQGIDCLTLGSAGGITDTASAMLAVARASGLVELLNPLTGMALGSLPPAPATIQASREDANATRLAGLHLLWSSGSEASASSSLPSVLSVTQGGAARLHTPAPAAADACADAESAQASSVAVWQEARAWTTPPQVCCTAFDAASSTLAVGCRGAEMRLFDASTGALAWAAKGGKPDAVGLVDKPWNTALAFLPSAGGGAANVSSAAGNAATARLLVGTGHHKLRLYDTAAGKRPQMDLSWGEARITALAVEADGQCCWVGNGTGKLEVLDLRTQRVMGGIKGLAGSVRSLALHPSAPLLASVGLDRYLRLHSTASRACLAKVYLKTQLTGVAFCPTDASMLSVQPEKREGEEQSAEDGGKDEVEDEQQAAGERRRKSSSGKERRQKKTKRQAADSGED